MSRVSLLLASALLVGAGAPAFADQSMNANNRAACAEIGFTPGTPAFAQCVADLDQSLDQLQSLPSR